MRKLNSKFFLAGLIAFGFASCDEENPLGSAGEVESKVGELYILAESTGSRIFNTIDLAMRDNDFITNDTTVIDGAMVTRDGAIIKINYGTGASGSDGILREGEINLLMSGGSDYMASGTSIAGTFLNYKEADKPVTGSFNVANQGNDVFALTLTSLSVTDAEDNTFSLSASKTLTWVDGFSTIGDVSDDSYTLSGTSTGVADTITLTASITSPLSYKSTCQYRLEEGVINLTMAGPGVTYTGGSIDFLSADGCNNLYSIELNSVDGGSVNTTLTFTGF